MEDDEAMEDGDDFMIDPELWLQGALMIASDKKSMEKVVQRIAAKTGLTPEKVEVVINAAIEYMMKKARSN